jgi:HSP20 family protein
MYADFDRLFAEVARRLRPGRFEPNADVYVDEDGDRIVVHVELAGADAESLRVGLDGRDLFIVGRRVDRSERSGSILQKEIQFGDFVKKLHLPSAVDDDGATATYRDGILTIVMPTSTNLRITPYRTEIRMTIKRIPA